MRNLVGALLVLLVLVAGAAAGLDFWVTQTIEERVAVELAVALAAPVTVEAVGWPASYLALTEGIPEVQIDAGPGAEGSALIRLDATLHEVLFEAEPRALWDPEEPVLLRADRGEATAVLLPGPTPLGARRATLQARDLSATLRVDRADVRLARVSLVASGLDEADELARVDADDVLLGVQVDGEAVEGVDATSAAGTVVVSGDAGAEALPLDVPGFTLDFEGLVARSRGSGLTMLASHAAVDARDVPLPDSEARLARMHADLPSAVAIVPAADQDGPTVLNADGGTVTATLTQAEVNALWPFPGELVLDTGTVGLALGPVTLEVRAEAENGLLLLRPVVPEFLDRLVGDIAELAITPALPAGATLEEVTVQPGAVELRATADRIELPP